MTTPTRRDVLRTAGALAAAALVPAARGQERPVTARRRPNILFFFPDQHRWDWNPSNPALPAPMPNLAKLARRGVAFERAYCAAPVCAPSRACLATGMEYESCGVPTMRVDFPRDRTTMYRQLRDSGYRALGCGKMDLAAKMMRNIIDGDGDTEGLGHDGRRFVKEWGFTDAVNNAGKGAGALVYLQEPIGPKDAYYAYLDGLAPPQGIICARDMEDRRTPDIVKQWSDTRPSLIAEEHYCDNWIARNGLALLAETPRDQPWFLQVNFAGPHPPFDIPARLERLYRGPDRVIDGFPQPRDYHGPLDAARHVAIRQNYAAMIENIDHWLGVYLDAVEARGELENTIVVWSSDHGEMLGDHGRWGKQIPFEPSVGVPLVAAGPGILKGHSSSAMVSLIDLTATFLDYGGVDSKPAMDGFSLRPLFEGKTETHRQHVLSGLYDWRLVFDGRYKLVTGFESDAPRLYDLAEDPGEDVDLAAKDPERVRKLQDLLRQGSYRPS